MRGVPLRARRRRRSPTSDRGRVEPAGERVANRRGERPRRRLVDQDARFTRHDRLDGAAPAEGDDRTSTRLRLDRHDAEVFLAGHQDQCGPIVLVANPVVGEAAEERHIAGGFGRQALEPRPVRPLADDRERNAGEAAGVDGNLEALVRNERRHDQTAALFDRNRHAWPEKIGVDGRIYHAGLAIIVSADPPRNMLGVRDIAVYAP
jgi:hypothetical protein